MNSPGIEVKELDYSNYVQSIATVSVGCIGEARRGPLEPTLVTSQEELIKTFGIPIEGKYGIYGAYQALTIVSNLYYQRIVGSGEKALAGQNGVDPIQYEMLSAGAEFNGYKVLQKIVTPTEGESANKLQAKIVTSKNDNLESFEADDITNLIIEINTKSKLISAVVPEGSKDISFIEKDLTFSGGVNGAKVATAGEEGESKYLLRSKYPDSDINGCYLEFGTKDNFGYYNVTILDPKKSIVERFISVTDDEDDDKNIVRYINNTSERIEIALINPNATDENYRYVFSGGDDGVGTITSSDIIGKVEDGSGMQSFSNPETVEINLMIIPGNTDAGVNAAAVTLAENRGDVLYIGDTPQGLSAKQAADYANAEGNYQDGFVFNSSYASLFYPWVVVSDPYTKKNITLPPSGAVVAQIAYSDSVAYPWFAPAGLNRGIMQNIINLERSPSQGERDVLYGNRNCVNPIVKFAGTGIVIWGQKTTQRKCTALDRINVRRLLNYLKKIISSASRYYLFEPNDVITWNKWIDMVNSTLNTVKTQRGINDLKVEMKPTAVQIDNYEMPGTIKIKPTKAAEFIELGFMIMATDTSFDESNI